MNFFKTTLLGVMIAGFTCANVSAANDQQNSKPESNQDTMQVQNHIIKNLGKLSVNQVKEVTTLLDELKAESLNQKESSLSHGAKTLGWLGLSGVFGVLTNCSFVDSLKLLGLAIKNVNALEEVCSPYFSAFPTYVCNETAMYAAGYGTLALFFILCTYSNGTISIQSLRNAINHMKSAINN